MNFLVNSKYKGGAQNGKECKFADWTNSPFKLIANDLYLKRTWLYGSEGDDGQSLVHYGGVWNHETLSPHIISLPYYFMDELLKEEDANKVDDFIERSILHYFPKEPDRLVCIKMTRAIPSSRCFDLFRTDTKKEEQKEQVQRYIEFAKSLVLQE